LTEENVHKIVRKDGSRLEFYGISELDKISLTPDSEEMYSQYKEAISRITTEA
jgi:hypothetical protein